MNRVIYPRIKRALDLLGASLGLLALAPLMLPIALVVLVTLGRPALFRQVRSGLAGRPFTLYKFRTMREARDAAGRPLSDAERLTSVGRFLRAASLDELPELWNVLRGEMSLVGPRPLLPEYLPRYTQKEARRLEVKPGLTGWAQINGRNALGWEERFALDVWYVDHCSLGLDLKIIFLTLSSLLRRGGINAPGHATMPEFRPELAGETTDRGRLS